MLTIPFSEDKIICTSMVSNIFQSWNLVHTGSSNTINIQSIFFCMNIRQHLYINLNLCQRCPLFWVGGGVILLRDHHFVTSVKSCMACLFYEHRRCNKINTLKPWWVQINIHFDNKSSHSHNNLQWKHSICNRDFK